MVNFSPLSLSQSSSLFSPTTLFYLKSTTIQTLFLLLFLQFSLPRTFSSPLFHGFIHLPPRNIPFSLLPPLIPQSHDSSTNPPLIDQSLSTTKNSAFFFSIFPPIMRPQQSPPSDAAKANRRRRLDLTIPLPLPQRDPALAVPLPLPPSSAPSSTTSGQLEYSDLERLSRIGSGAGGTVYKVVHKPTGKLYALKVIYGNHEDAVRNQMCREIQILRDVDHPNVVKCHNLFDHCGEIQVLLEFMDKGSLEGNHISDERTLSNLARQVLVGLSYLHKRKIVHRDIKPSNLLINSRRMVKIADFGVSRVLAQTMDPCNSSVGTIAYMSPERINTDLNHGQYDGYAGDIWSLGVSILEFYLGKFPFSVERQGDWASLMCAICMSQPPEAPVTASREFRDFVACCLQRDPPKRWTAAQLLQHPFIVQYGSPVSGGSNMVHHQAHQLLPPPPRQHSSA